MNFFHFSFLVTIYYLLYAPKFVVSDDWETKQVSWQKWKDSVQPSKDGELTISLTVYGNGKTWIDLSNNPSMHEFLGHMHHAIKMNEGYALKNVSEENLENAHKVYQ